MSNCLGILLHCIIHIIFVQFMVLKNCTFVSGCGLSQKGMGHFVYIWIVVISTCFKCFIHVGVYGEKQVPGSKTSIARIAFQQVLIK